MTTPATSDQQSSTPFRLPPLRDYQVQAGERLRAASRNLLLVAPTGSGKTRILLEDAKRSRGPILLICPWRSLVFQTAERFQRAGIPTGILLRGRRPTPGDKVVCTTLATAYFRGVGPGFRRVYFDEAHGSVSRTALEVLERCRKALIIGCTATACRLDNEPLGKVYDDLYEAASTHALIRAGVLVQPTVWAPPGGPPDLSGVRWSKARGDYVPQAAATVMTKPKLLGDSLAHWQEHARGKRTFAYCCNIPHAQVVYERYRAAGVSCDLVTGATPQTKRAELLEAVRNRELQILINVAVLTEGIDLPELECELILRPTLSPGLHLQMIGRGLRTAPGKQTCVYLDHAGNFDRHGFPEDDWRWTLNPKKIKRKTAEKGGKSKQCPHCHRTISASAVTCPHCHALFVPGEVKGKKLKRLKWWKRRRISP